MKFNNPKIEKLYEYLSRISIEAYKDQFLISNIIFSKQESRARILETYLVGEAPPKITFIFALKQFFFYFLKNISGWLLTLITAILHRFSGQKYHIEEKEDLVLLDIYFVNSQIIEKGSYEDPYFPGLSEKLTKMQKPFVYTPRWFGSKQPFVLFKVFKVLKKMQVPVLTPYQLFGVKEYLKVFRFLIFYPFSVFRFMKKLGTSYEDKLIHYALWEVFDGGVVESYMRYLFGQRLSKTIEGQIKCISWYENLPSDKNFFLGLRTLPEKTKIFGAQLFLGPKTLLNLMPDEVEVPFKVVPDKILVNGPGYQFDSGSLWIDVGPSLRYKFLFEEGAEIIKGKNILVLLPYWDNVVDHMLDVIREVDWPVPIVIKFHPTMDWKKYKTKIPKNFSVTDEALSSLLSRALITVGHSTGALIEAAALGIPVVDIQFPDNFSHSYMPEMGEGVIWGKANNSKEVELLIKKFDLALQENPEKLKQEGRRIRSFCFSEPTDELISHAFELK